VIALIHARSRYMPVDDRWCVVLCGPIKANVSDYDGVVRGVFLAQ